MTIWETILQRRGYWRCALIFGVVMLVAACSHMAYYVQAAQGQLTLMAQARDIDAWLADPDASETLKKQLALAKEVRRFAVQELQLPDNATFTSYAQLQRPYVLWNVVATPVLSLQTKQWCFPIAGCVSYRGYYSLAAAQAYATELRAKNYDVSVSGVPAYSTLGWFNDPLLSTFIQYSEIELARLIFHELAHQIVYVPGDTRFNESFAVAVEEFGVSGWIQDYGDEKMRAAYLAQTARKQEFLRLLLQTRKALEENYASTVSDTQKLARKAKIFQELLLAYANLKQQWGGYAGYDRWFAEPLNNAQLALVGTYNDFVPSFRALLQQEKDLRQFYAAVRHLSGMSLAQRHQYLISLETKPGSAALTSHIVATKD